MNELQITDYKTIKRPEDDHVLININMFKFRFEGGYDGEDVVTMNVYNSEVGWGINLTIDKFSCEIDCREAMVYIEHFLKAKKLAEDWLNKHYPQPNRVFIN